MRKIESLQENEALLIKTKKEAKKIGKMTGLDLLSAFLPSFVSRSGSNYWFTQGCTTNEIILPASDFIKKSKTKQRLKALEEKVAGLIASTVVETELKKIKDEPKLEALPEKWYNHEAGGIVYIIKIEDEKVHIYGFNSAGNWFDYTTMIIDYLNYLTPATDKEVEEALINEAKKRYKEGDIVFDEYSNCEITIDRLDDIRNENVLWAMRNNNARVCLLKGGNWATIIDQPKEIDFSVAGQLVTNINGVVWLTSGEHNDKYFKATVLKHRPQTVGKVKEGVIKQGVFLLTEPFTINPQP